MSDTSDESGVATPWELLSAAGQSVRVSRFESMRSKAWATITMPEVPQRESEETLTQESLVLPFPCIRLVEPFTLVLDDVERLRELGSPEYLGRRLTGLFEMVVWAYETEADGTPSGNGYGASMEAISRITIRSADLETTTAYETSLTKGSKNTGGLNFVRVVTRFNRWGKDRTARFRETVVSRQVKRWLGVSKDYREFVIVRKADATREQWTGALAMRKMAPLLNSLHSVRSHSREEHLRQLPSGDIVIVKGSIVTAHVRGKGDALQVKDYVAKPSSRLT